jgi:Leu/Phe-tRNA-protein transferase
MASDEDPESRAPHGDGDGGGDDQGDQGDEGGWPKGLVAIGGRLDAETLTRAYRAGVFPWSSDPEITWWSPDPRAIFDLDSFRASRSLR